MRNQIEKKRDKETDEQLKHRETGERKEKTPKQISYL